MVLLDSFCVRYALCQSQNFFRQVTLLSRELLKTAKVKRSRIVPQMFSELPKLFDALHVSCCYINELRMRLGATHFLAGNF
jgi:hypothetical protein